MENVEILHTEKGVLQIKIVINNINRFENTKPTLVAMVFKLFFIMILV